MSFGSHATSRVSRDIMVVELLQRVSSSLSLWLVEVSESGRGGERRRARGTSSIEDAGLASKDQQA
ncbi:MAG: hypothetical protein ACI9MR_003831 [Myxococcota bacterium]|jgi:hypothetical protein